MTIPTTPIIPGSDLFPAHPEDANPPVRYWHPPRDYYPQPPREPIGGFDFYSEDHA